MRMDKLQWCLVQMHRGLKLHWPMDENHVTWDEVHVTYFLPNLFLSLKWNATNSDGSVILMTFLKKPLSKSVALRPWSFSIQGFPMAEDMDPAISQLLLLHHSDAWFCSVLFLFSDREQPFCSWIYLKYRDADRHRRTHTCVQTYTCMSIVAATQF